MLTVMIILVLIAIGTTVAHAMSPSRCPVYVPLFTLCLIELIRTIPLGK